MMTADAEPFAVNGGEPLSETSSKARKPTFGAGDFCLIAAVPLDDVIAHLHAEHIALGDRPGAPARCARAAALGLLPRPGRQPGGGGRVRRGVTAGPGGSTGVVVEHLPQPNRVALRELLQALARDLLGVVGDAPLDRLDLRGDLAERRDLGRIDLSVGG